MTETRTRWACFPNVCVQTGFIAESQQQGKTQAVMHVPGSMPFHLHGENQVQFIVDLYHRE